MSASLQDVLVSMIKTAVCELWGLAPTEEEIALDYPTDRRFGDLSTSVSLRLAKQIKKNPREIAAQITASLESRRSDPRLEGAVKQVKAEGAGFINLYLQERYFYVRLEKVLNEGAAALRSERGEGRKVLIEFVSANPTGPLSVAHARQAAVGDALANIFSFMGFCVSREYYLNDEGNQIAILGKSVELRRRQLAGETVDFPQNHYQGEYIYEIARKMASSSEGEECAEYAAAYILQIIKKELADFGVGFDCWYSQKALGKSGKIEQALDALRRAGYLYDSEGAVWLRSTAFGDDKDRVVIKSDGSYTYLAPDIAYHKEKYERGYQWLINLWGPDHHGYIGRIRAAVQAQGYAPETLSVVIVQLASIFRDGTIIEMSTRKGQYITLREVLDEVGKDAARFFFLMRRTSSHLDFDLEIAKKHTPENPVYYVQYAHARICSILRNSPEYSPDSVDLTLLTEAAELALIKKILQFPAVLDICFYTCDSYMVTVYLQELAEAFHKFYDLHRVLGEDMALTRARLALIDGAKTSLALGLKLLGVSAPESM